jgi:CRP-like cAMP-binding protein
MHENSLIEYFSKFTTFSESESQAIRDSMLTKDFKRGSFLAKEGRPNTNTYFIISGLVRRYKMIKGEEVTTGFYTEGQWIVSLTGFTKDTMATDYLICSEDVSVVVGDEQKASRLFQQFPGFETISRAVMETVFAEQHKTMSHYLTDSPEERYVRLLETRPDLFQRVPQYQLASYIGVKPESLSRIRKRMAQK